MTLERLKKGQVPVISELLHTFDGTMLFAHQSVADLSDDEMVLQPPGAPNHTGVDAGSPHLQLLGGLC